MTDLGSNPLQNVTINDVQLAAVYYAILVALARHKHCLTYGELVEKAKRDFPGNSVVQGAIPVSTGRKLEVVRMFTAARQLPDLTSLVIGKNSGECGVGFRFDPVLAREQVFAFDWSKVSTDFDGYIKTTEKALTPRKRRKKEEALALMSEYYSNNRDKLPPSIRSKRDEIIELLLEGVSAEDAFTQCMND